MLVTKYFELGNLLQMIISVSFGSLAATTFRRKGISFPGGLIIAIFGALGFLITGIILKANLPLSVGFINIPAFLIFIPITTFMARIGAKTTHRIDKNKLQRMFGVFLYIIGAVFFYRYLIL